MKGYGFLFTSMARFRDFKTTTQVFMLEVDFKAKQAVKRPPPSRLECGGRQCGEKVHTDKMKFCEHRLGTLTPKQKFPTLLSVSSFPFDRQNQIHSSFNAFFGLHHLP